MCRVIIDKPSEHMDFILFNHLYNRKDDNFTAAEIAIELQQYHMNVKEERIQEEINNMIKNGLVIQGVDKYKRAAIV